MGGNKCCVSCCGNQSSNKPGLRFHVFPLKDIELRNLWLERTDMLHILANERSLLNVRVCHDHFDDMCKIETRKGLKDFSVPIHHLPRCNLPPIYENCYLLWTDDLNADPFPSTTIGGTPERELLLEHRLPGIKDTKPLPEPEILLNSTPLQSSCDKNIKDEPSKSISDTIINDLLPESQLTTLSSRTNYVQKEPLSVPFIIRDPTISYRISYSTSNDESSIADESIDVCSSTFQPVVTSLESDYMVENVEINQEMSDDNIMDTIETQNINEAEEYLNIEEVCRLCLQKKEEMSVIQESGIADMLFDCASIKVTAENGLFNLVCSQCVNNVNEWYKFKQQVVKSFEIGNVLIENNQDSKQFLKELCRDETIQNENCSDNIMPNTVDFTADYSDQLECETNYDRCEISEKKSKKTKDTNKLLECRQKTSLLLEGVLKRKICDKVYNCISCNKKFNSVSKKSYSNEKPFRCDGCTKDLKTNSAVRIHISTKDKKSYQCQLCNQLFATSNNLDIHMRKHSRQFPCPVKCCDKSFFEKEPMERHYSATHFNVEHNNEQFPSPVTSPSLIRFK